LIAQFARATIALMASVGSARHPRRLGPHTVDDWITECEMGGWAAIECGCDRPAKESAEEP
jgi:hypothetical protein